MRAAKARIEERQLGRTTPNASAVDEALVLDFIARLYSDKGLEQHLENDLVGNKAMNTLKKTVRQLLTATAPDHELSRLLLTQLSKWPLPDEIHSRPSMFEAAVRYVAPQLDWDQPVSALRDVSDTSF